MKKIMLLILIAISATSCVKNPPLIGDNKDPFVVKLIEKYNDSLSLYSKNNSGFSNKSASFFPEEIILPSGLYNIGDTIKPPTK